MHSLNAQTAPTPPTKRDHKLILLRDLLSGLQPALRREHPGLGEDVRVVVDVVDGHADAGAGGDVAAVGEGDAARGNEARGARGGRRGVAEAFFDAGGLEGGERGLGRVCGERGGVWGRGGGELTR